MGMDIEDQIRTYGCTSDEWVRKLPLRIEDDQESLWGILAKAKNYRFEGTERMDFIRLCLRSMLDAGAVPVEPTGWAWPPFRPVTRFGTRRDEIVNNVIAEWQARGGGDLDWGQYAFTFPENFEIEDDAEWRRVNEARLRRLFPERDFDWALKDVGFSTDALPSPYKRDHSGYRQTELLRVDTSLGLPAISRLLGMRIPQEASFASEQDIARFDGGGMGPFHPATD